MKKLLKYIGSLFCLLLFATQVNALTPNVSLTLACPGTIISGTSLNVNASYGYSNIVGNVTVKISFDNSKVNFLNSSGFAITPSSFTDPLTPTITTLTYLIPATAALNQTGAIQLHFAAICPQTCFGVTNVTNFSGVISAPGATTISSNTCGTNLNVINDWGGSIYSTSYNCKLNQVTFNGYFSRSSCYRIINPSITITSTVGTLISSSAGTISGSTILLSSSLYSNFYFNYTIQLPCASAAGGGFTSGPVTTTAILNGENCGVNIPNLKTLTNTYTVAPQNSYATLGCSAASGTSYILSVSNNGLIPINVNLSTLLPNLNYTSFTHSTTQTTPLSGTYTTFDCSSASLGTSSFTSTTSSSSPITIGSIKKLDFTLSNLAPGKSFTVIVNYSGTTPSCLPSATLPYNFSTTGTYTGVPSPTDCNCTGDVRNLVPVSCSFNIVTPVYVPNVYCNKYSDYDNTLCHRAGEVVNFCLYFRNNGTGPLENGTINLALPSYLNLNTSSVTFNGSSTGVSATSSGIVTLPISIPQGSTNYVVCFSATINTSATNGLHTYNPTIIGSNMTVKGLCDYKVLICQDPKAEISKLVKGSEDATFSTSGSAMAGTMATYQITVTNSGNTPISSIEILDRLPQLGDQTIRNCNPRGSQFSVLPNGIFSPTSLASSATYSTSAPGINNVPASWLGGLSGFACDISGTFTAGPKNTVYVNLPSPILPFTNYTFEMQVLIPATAKGGDQICNTVALKTNYQDETGTEYPLEIIESDKVCLTIAPPPCKPCPEMVRSETVTMNPGTSSTIGAPYVTKTGYVTVTTLKPVQEIHISISDLKYHFNKPECKDCKTPALSRGGIFPLATTQTVGTLNWDDYTGSAIPPTTPVANLPQELIWNLGVMLEPGTYTIPFQLTLPQSIIPDCCELIIDQLALKVSIKDADCNLCENVIVPSKDDCCTGSEWGSKQMTWSLLPDFPRESTGKLSDNVNRKSQLAETIAHNKLVKNNAIVANLIPNYGVLTIECGATYRINEGANRTFKAVYKCNPNLKNCESQSLVSITTISGNYINVINQPMPYNQTFTLPGTYKIKYVGICGGVICNTCEYTLVVEKNCCVGIIKKDKTTIKTSSLLNSNITSEITSGIQHFTTLNPAIVKLNYSCPTGCAATYSWVKKRNGVIIDSGISASSTINFDPPTSGEVLIQITVNCGGQNCYKTEQFYLGCVLCMWTPHTGSSIKKDLNKINNKF